MIVDRVRKEMAFDLKLKDEKEGALPGAQRTVFQEGGTATCYII